MMHTSQLSLSPADTVKALRSALEWTFGSLSRSALTVSGLTLWSVFADLRATSAMRALQEADEATIARARAYHMAALATTIKVVWIFAGVLVFLLGHALLIEKCDLCLVEDVYGAPAALGLLVSGVGMVLWPQILARLASRRNQNGNMTAHGPPQGFNALRSWVLSKLAPVASDAKAVVVNGSLLMIFVLDVSVFVIEHLIGHPL